jgi:hypothetical protein
MDEGKFNQEKMNLFLLCWLNLRPNKEERKRHFNVVGIIEEGGLIWNGDVETSVSCPWLWNDWFLALDRDNGH